MRDEGDGWLAVHKRNEFGFQQLRNAINILTFWTAPSLSISMAHRIAIT